MTSDDFIVRIIPLPKHIKALTCIDDSGFANIYVNNQLSEHDRNAAIRHELKHVRRDDAYNDLAIQTAEK